MTYAILIFLFCAVVVIVKVDKDMWEFLEHKIVDIAWVNMMPKRFVVAIAAIVFIVLIPLLFLRIITKPIRGGKK